MIGSLHHQNVAPTGVGPCHAEGQFVGLAPRAHEIDDGEGVGQCGNESFGVLHQEIVEVPGVGVQEGHLLLTRRHHPGVVVSDVGDVVHAVQVDLSFVVEKELPGTPDDLQGIPVGDAQGRAEVLSPGFKDLVFGEPACIVQVSPGRPPGFGRAGVEGAGIGLSSWAVLQCSVRDPKNQVGIGRESLPEGTLRRECHTREGAVQPESVSDDLKVEVGSPIPVDREVPDPREGISSGKGLSGVEARQDLGVQVAVEGPVAQGASHLHGSPVFQDNRRPVVHLAGVVPHRMHHGFEGSENPGSGLEKEVDPQVDGPPLRGAPLWALKCLRGVPGAHFVVPSHTYLSRYGFQLSKQEPGPPCRISWSRRLGKLLRSARKVEYVDWRLGQVQRKGSRRALVGPAYPAPGPARGMPPSRGFPTRSRLCRLMGPDQVRMPLGTGDAGGPRSPCPAVPEGPTLEPRSPTCIRFPVPGGVGERRSPRWYRDGVP